MEKFKEKLSEIMESLNESVSEDIELNERFMEIYDELNENVQDLLRTIFKTDKAMDSVLALDFSKATDAEKAKKAIAILRKVKDDWEDGAYMLKTSFAN
jgi:hypothetical protein